MCYSRYKLYSLTLDEIIFSIDVGWLRYRKKSVTLVMKNIKMRQG